MIKTLKNSSLEKKYIVIIKILMQNLNYLCKLPKCSLHLPPKLFKNLFSIRNRLSMLSLSYQTFLGVGFDGRRHT